MIKLRDFDDALMTAKAQLQRTRDGDNLQVLVTAGQGVAIQID